MEVESLGGSRYFVTLIDDASRKLWVYFLRTKGEVFQYFKRFHAMVERQAGKPLKCLRSDNGGSILPMNSRIIVLSMASGMRRLFLEPHNIMVWLKESTEPLWRK
ncbi:Unknown protein [Striga hermonthica]|uniref:Integrase catalytic domain-containing protein n=1 Tax=Striga hermonthica TaxID=68872 RepID=A0A9N7NEM8_STRHE|nr:Unknown protein [Striga hermonthica]